MNDKIRYAIVGLGYRSHLYIKALASKYSATSELVAFCDVNQTRMNFANRVLRSEYDAEEVRTYKASDFDLMIKETQPDWVIVSSVDSTHDRYITRSMELGCDVITEKPMTIDVERCRRIVDTINKTGKQLKLTFNYRFAPFNTRIKELLEQMVIGEIYSVHFEWLLDINHGADYFRRWHRNKEKSGGLLVHKSCHHFDLINWWLNTSPEVVYARGGLRFYGSENAERRGVNAPSQRYHGEPASRQDPFAINLAGNPLLSSMYLEAEKEDGYIRDQNVFGRGIDIEDTIAVLVQYRDNAVLTYSLNAYLPWEGFCISFNGSMGRMEVNCVESIANNGNKNRLRRQVESQSIRVYPIMSEPYDVDVPIMHGGHYGGDEEMLKYLFNGEDYDPMNRIASHVDGAYSLMTGIAANQSLDSGRPVHVHELLNR